MSVSTSTAKNLQPGLAVRRPTWLGPLPLALGALALLFSYRVAIPRDPSLHLTLANPAMLAEALVLCVLALYAAWRLPTLMRHSLGAVGWLMLAYLVVAGVSIVQTPNPLFAAAVWGKLAVAVVVSLEAGRCCRSAGQVRWLVAAAAVGLLLHCLVPWGRVMVDPEHAFHHANERIEGAWISPVNWSMLAAVTAYVGLIALRHVEGFWWKLLPGFVAGLGMVSLIFSMGKTGLVALQAGVLAYALAGRRGRFLLAYGVIFIATLLPIWFWYPIYSDYWQQYFGNNYIWTLSGRTDLWTSLATGASEQVEVVASGRPSTTAAATMAMTAAEHTDVGKGLLGHLLGDGYTALRQGGVRASGLEWVSSNAHSAYVGVLYETGLLGLMMILSLIGATGAALWRCLVRKSNTPSTRQAAAELAGLFILVLVAGLAMDLFGGMPRAESMLLFPLCAAAWALRRVRETEECLRRNPSPTAARQVDA